MSKEDLRRQQRDEKVENICLMVRQKKPLLPLAARWQEFKVRSRHARRDVRNKQRVVMIIQ
jgi:hypothetical protein